GRPPSQAGASQRTVAVASSASAVTSVGASGAAGSTSVMADPAKSLSIGSPTSPVLPSDDSATYHPSSPKSPVPLPGTFGPCCDHTAPWRVNDQAAPYVPSNGPPTSAVRPSDDSATPQPTPAKSVASDAVSLAPVWAQVEPERAKTHAAPEV